jgi:Prolyl oligopeptidase, N-terminal beta-propeller domain
MLLSPLPLLPLLPLQINIHDSCDPVNRLFYIDMSAFDGTNCSTLGPLVKLVDTFENKYSYVTNEGRTFWFRSNLNAPRYKVIKLQLPPNGSPMETDPNILAALPKVRHMFNSKDSLLVAGLVQM